MGSTNHLLGCTSKQSFKAKFCLVTPGQRCVHGWENYGLHQGPLSSAAGNRTQKMWGWVKFSRERPGKHLGFIIENPMKISHVTKPLLVFIYTHTYFVPENQMFFDFQLCRLWALSREPTVLHLECSIRDLDKFTSAGHHCVNAHVHVYIDTIHCIHTQYIYIYIYTYTYILCIWLCILCRRRDKGIVMHRHFFSYLVWYIFSPGAICIQPTGAPGEHRGQDQRIRGDVGQSGHWEGGTRGAFLSSAPLKNPWALLGKQRQFCFGRMKMKKIAQKTGEIEVIEATWEHGCVLAPTRSTFFLWWGNFLDLTLSI